MTGAQLSLEIITSIRAISAVYNAFRIPVHIVFHNAVYNAVYIVVHKLVHFAVHTGS